MDRGITLQASDQFAATPGWGVTAHIGDERIWVGKDIPDWSPPLKANTDIPFAKLRDSGFSTLIIGSDKRGAIGMIALADRIREDARQTIVELNRIGIHTMMLSGDVRAVAESIAKETGIEDVQADLLPDEKLQLVQKMRRQYGPIAMVGDGINDAPALAAADLGITMGVVGTDVALETGDVVLTSDELRRIPLTLELGRQAAVVIQQNLIWAITVISVLLIGALGGWLTLTLAVICHEGSTLLGILNGLRLLRSRKSRTRTP